MRAVLEINVGVVSFRTRKISSKLAMPYYTYSAIVQEYFVGNIDAKMLHPLCNQKLAKGKKIYRSNFRQ